MGFFKECLFVVFGMSGIFHFISLHVLYQQTAGEKFCVCVWGGGTNERCISYELYWTRST